MTITLDEWVKAVQQAEGATSAEGFTSIEMADALGYKADYFRHTILPRLIDKGLVRFAGKRVIKMRNNYLQRVPVYELLSKTIKAKAKKA